MIRAFLKQKEVKLSETLTKARMFKDDRQTWCCGKQHRCTIELEMYAEMQVPR